MKPYTWHENGYSPETDEQFLAMACAMQEAIKRERAANAPITSYQPGFVRHFSLITNLTSDRPGHESAGL